MRPITSVFLAGPDLWFPEAPTLLARKRALCEQAGFIGVTAREDPPSGREPDELTARKAYADALLALRSCEAVVANLTPWRGPGCDPGTAFEVGFAAALNLPVFAYMNVTSEDEADARERVEMLLGAEPDGAGVWRDPEGCEVEDFGLPETLMLWAEARRFITIVTPDPFEDLTGLELCLDALAAYAE